MFKIGDKAKLRDNYHGHGVGEIVFIREIDDCFFDYLVRGGGDLFWVKSDDLAPAVPDGWTPASEPPSGSKPARNVEIMLEDGKRGYGFYKVTFSRWFVFGDGADIERIKSDWMYSYNTAPGEVVAWREIQPEPERLKVGQRVRVKEGVHPARSYKSGEIGVVMEDDNSSLPYRVEFSDDFWWCSADDLEPLDAEPEPEEDAPYYVEYLTMDDEEQVRSGAHDLKTALDMAKVDARNSGRLVAVYRKVYEVRPGKPEVIKVEG